LAQNLARLETRLGAACAAARRARDDVTLVAVTKTFPASDARLLVELGVADLGESRDQEASAKAAALRDLAVRWHFVGQLQTNKCASVASYADVVHSVDRDRVVAALDDGARAAQRTIDVLLQVSLDDDPHRGGVPSDGVPALAARVLGAGNLRLRGVMAVAPLGGDAAVAFERLVVVAAALRSEHPDATVISAGMTGDLEEAVQAGATHVRIGTALLGDRPPRVG
jgi:hypothetical protein